ncbi:hypothetical protein KL946_002674 [Ogataea haglerorum]|uniref:Ribosomal RNA-processing protein 14/surfeit locus protein 6 C-terminal domain-containing protein n=1 Tax=Ogataea haglerorum TaxID=1937702 RepID=A0ABQ7RFL0_9ASCO|nr:hypothetical protein KL946_002674 [Ogataea haglerorum]KAG7801378.1 hypothetical protein KL944_003110 [Ogataea haglerorum]
MGNNSLEYYYDEDTSNQWQRKKQSKSQAKENKKAKLDPEATRDVSAKEEKDRHALEAKPVIIPGKKQESAPVEEPAAVEAQEPESTATDTELKLDDATIVFDDDGDGEGDTAPPPPRKSKQQLTPEKKKEKAENLARLRAKLAEKINTLKEKRKAPGTKFATVTSRQQILEERRKKEALRRQQKKTKEEKDDDDDKSSSEDEDMEDKDDREDVVMYNNIEFNQGERATSDLSGVRKVGRRKGPSNNDVKAHLKKAEQEKAKLAAMDKEQAQAVEEKHRWNKALAGAQGIKVKDDVKLLKKALKRKEAKKRKSEREWAERKQFVADQIKAKQDRREENLRIRRENKGKSRKHQTKQLRSFKGTTRVPKRAGFEGKIKRKS